MNIKILNRFLLLLLGAVVISCNETTPKPIGYLRFDPAKTTFEALVQPKQIGFEKNSMAQVTNLKSLYHNESFILKYEQFDAAILCSFICFEQDQFYQYSEESRNLVYQHTAVATEITESSFADPPRALYGKIYDLSGQVATPIQFELTDSTSRFFRGSLIFNCVPNQDSLKPYVRYIREDILHLIQTFNWKH